MNRFILTIGLILLALSAGCGSEAFPSDVPTETLPLISSVDPSTGSAGDVITVRGVGFSYAAPNNVIIVGGASISADDYFLIEDSAETEAEALTAAVPDGATAGESSVIVVVHGNTSNSNVTFIVQE